MSDSGFDLLIYIALTIGASALGLLKSSKEKKEKSRQPEILLPEYEYEEEPEQEPVVVFQQPEKTFDEVFNREEPSERMQKEREEGISTFGRTDEERYAILEKRQQEGRMVRKRAKDLFKEEEEQEASNEQSNKDSSKRFKFDLREAVIANEILNRKY